MKNGKKLSKIFAVIALVILVIAIIGKLAYSMDPVVLVCAAGVVLAASQLVNRD